MVSNIIGISVVIFIISSIIYLFPRMKNNKEDFERKLRISNQRDIIISLMNQIVNDQTILHSLKMAYITELHIIFKKSEVEDYEEISEEYMKEVEDLRERYKKIRSILTLQEHE